MAKKKQKIRREPTRRQLSHFQREKRRQRIIFFSGVFIIAVVVFGLLAGWMVTQYLPMHQVVIKVNDRAFNMGYYIDMLGFYGGSNISEMADYVITTIKQSELIREDSAKRGITISKSELDKELKKRNPPMSAKYADALRTQLLVTKMSNEYFDKQVPASAAQRHVMAMLLESEKQALDVKKRLDNGESFEKLAEELSVNENVKTLKGDLGWHPEGMLANMFSSSKLEQYAFTADAGYVSDPIFDDAQTKGFGYWIVRVLERKENPQEAHVQGILLGSEEEAQKVKTRLDAGENFGALAKELTQDPNSKDAEGDLGWVTPQQISKDVSDYIFNTNTELNKLSNPIKDNTISTTGAYWLIKVVEISSDRPLDDENKTAWKNRLISEWIEGLSTDPNYKVQDFFTAELRDFAVKQAVKNASKKQVPQG